MADDFYEMVIKGSYDRTRAFVEGFLAGAGASKGKILFARDCGIRQEKLSERIAEWAGLVKDKVHLVVPKALLAPLRAAIRKRGADAGVEVITEHRIVHATLPFEFRCYNREIGESILKRLRRMPPGLEMLEGYRPIEDFEPEAKGPEMYSPEHEYTVRGKGKIRGPIDRLVRFRETLDEEYELIELGLIRLESA